MGTSDRLLQLLIRLQQAESVAYDTDLATLYSLIHVPGEGLYDLHQHILSQMGQAVQARGASLLLYQVTLRRFIATENWGEALPWNQLASELTAVSQHYRDPGQLGTRSFSSREIVLVPLASDESSPGLVALSFVDREELEYTLDQHRSLLLSMGKIATLLLQNYQRRQSEREEAVEHERNRIARDIHDGVAQQLAHVLHKIEFVRSTLERQPKQDITPSLRHSLAELQHAHHVLESSLSDLHHDITSLLPRQLEGQNFAAALQELLERYQENSPDLEIVYSLDELILVPIALEGVIYRFIQEALNNVEKHAHARHVTIQLRMLSDLLLVEVSDDGAGFQTQQIGGDRKSRTGIGLQSMRDRVQEAGGQWEIRSQPGDGTIVTARFPLTGPVTTLTNREREVLRLMVEGLTNRAIAERLSISVETVKSHVHHIMQKMQVKDRTQAAVVATRQRFFTPL